MKKLILTESQVKIVVEHLMNESDEDLMNQNMAVQCFLNQKYRANIKVDGYIGDQTKKLIERLQSEKGIFPADGMWGRQTLSKLSKSELGVFRQCTSQHGDMIDKIADTFGF